MLGCVYNAPNLLCFLRLNRVITSTECLHQIRWQSESFWELPLCQSSSYSLGILRFEPVKQGVLVEGSGSGAVAAVTLDVGNCVRVLHNLDEPHFVPGRQAAVRDHPVFAKKWTALRLADKISPCTRGNCCKNQLLPEIQTFFLPQILHELDHLQGQHVLSKV